MCRRVRESRFDHPPGIVLATLWMSMTGLIAGVLDPSAYVPLPA